MQAAHRANIEKNWQEFDFFLARARNRERRRAKIFGKSEIIYLMQELRRKCCYNRWSKHFFKKKEREGSEDLYPHMRWIVGKPDRHRLYRVPRTFSISRQIALDLSLSLRSTRSPPTHDPSDAWKSRLNLFHTRGTKRAGRRAPWLSHKHCCTKSFMNRNNNNRVFIFVITSDTVISSEWLLLLCDFSAEEIVLPEGQTKAETTRTEETNDEEAENHANE